MNLKSNYLQQTMIYVIAILLTIVLAPKALLSFRPYFLVLCLYYWAARPVALLPVFWIWCIGLVLDLTSGTLLGQHALVLVIIDLALKEVQPRLRLYGFWQHALLMLLLSGFYVLLQSWFMVNIAHVVVVAHYYYGILGTMLVWAVMYFAMQKWRLTQLI